MKTVDAVDALLRPVVSQRLVRRLCDHVLWIEKGVARMQGEVNEVCDAYMKEMKK